MMFKIGECVVHKTEGVCQIDSIIDRDFGFGKTEYYVLKPYYKNGISTGSIMVPVDNCQQIRPHISKTDAEKLVLTLDDFKDIWVSDSKHRKETFTKIINDGDLESLCSLIHTVYLKKAEYAEIKKNIPITDNSLSALAERLAHEELAIALGIKPNEVEDYISRKLNK